MQRLKGYSIKFRLAAIKTHLIICHNSLNNGIHKSLFAKLLNCLILFRRASSLPTVPCLDMCCCCLGSDLHTCLVTGGHPFIYMKAEKVLTEIVCTFSDPECNMVYIILLSNKPSNCRLNEHKIKYKIKKTSTDIIYTPSGLSSHLAE